MTLTEDQRRTLDHWAEIVGYRGQIEEFLAFAWERGFGVESINGRKIWNQNAMLNEFFEVDTKALEEARRALLEEARK